MKLVYAGESTNTSVSLQPIFYSKQAAESRGKEMYTDCRKCVRTITRSWHVWLMSSRSCCRCSVTPTFVARRSLCSVWDIWLKSQSTIHCTCHATAEKTTPWLYWTASISANLSVVVAPLFCYCSILSIFFIIRVFSARPFILACCRTVFLVIWRYGVTLK